MKNLFYALFFCLACEQELTQNKQEVRPPENTIYTYENQKKEKETSVLEEMLRPEIGIPSLVLTSVAVGGGSWYLYREGRRVPVVIEPVSIPDIQSNFVSKNIEESKYESVNSVFFLNVSPQEKWVVKPENLHKKMRTSIKPGREIFNEALMWDLNEILGRRYGVPQTFLVKLTYEGFKNDKNSETTKWCSVQRFIEGEFLESLKDVKEVKQDSLSIKLISNTTDGHRGNFIFTNGNKNKKKLYLIDNGYDFLTPTKDKPRLDLIMWPVFKKPLSKEESTFLASIQVDEVMDQIQKKINQYSEDTKILPGEIFSMNQQNALKAQLLVAKKIGELRLSAYEWYRFLDPTLDLCEKKLGIQDFTSLMWCYLDRNSGPNKVRSGLKEAYYAFFDKNRLTGARLERWNKAKTSFEKEAFLLNFNPYVRLYDEYLQNKKPNWEGFEREMTQSLEYIKANR